MASKNIERLSVAFKADEPIWNKKTKLEKIDLIKRIHLLNNGREVGTIKNKKLLEGVIKNIHGGCPDCNSNFSK